MKKLLLFMLLVMTMPVMMMAGEEVTIDGIKYNLVKKAQQAEVIAVSIRETITIPSTIVHDDVTYSVTSIGSEACRAWGVSNYNTLISVTISEGVTSIGSKAFYYNQALSSITIPSSVTSIEGDAFLECPKLSSVHISDLAAWCNISFNSNPFFKAHHLYLNDQEITDLVIPEGVTSIGNYAFEYCTGLTSVTIPNSVTSIGDNAFNRCSGLTSVTIPNSVTSIGGSAFSYCTGLTSVDIPNSVTSIGGSAFSYTGLTSVNIGNSVTSIGDYAFNRCSGLTSVTIPNSVTQIGKYAFSYCSGLTSVTIPNSVGYIRDYAFNYCSRLTSVDISDWTYIGSYAFANCEVLEVVTCHATSVPTTQSNAFDNSYVEYAKLIVPDEAYDAYSTTAPWSNFGTKLKLSEATMVTANSYTREYGEPNPEFGYTSGTILNGTPEITCAATETSAPGIYPITISQGTVTNTGLVFVDGTLTITKAPLTITAKDYTVTVGDDLPTFEAEYEGFKNNDDETILTTAPSFSCAATNTNTDGFYDITVRGAASDRYDITYVKGQLTIVPTEAVINISSAGMATYCSPYDLDFSGVKNLKAYIISGYDWANKKVFATRVYDVPAGTGLYLVAPEGEYHVNIGSTSCYYINMLVGTTSSITLEPTDGDVTNLILTGTSPQNASFKTLAASRTFGANKAYLQIPTSVLSSSANAVGIIFDDETDGIESISGMGHANGDWFTLDGRKLNSRPAQKGVYILNGNKIVIK